MQITQRPMEQQASAANTGAQKMVRKSPREQRNVKIILISALIGVLAGLVSVLYRLMLSGAETLSYAMYDYVRGHLFLVPLLFIGLTALGLGIGALTRKYPLISGSGIPQLKAQITGYIGGRWCSTLFAKLIGGSAAIVAGLSLGREGPSIQLGACVADGIANKMTDDAAEKRIYLASGASAGLAAAFNAPLAGVMFALEEIFKYFSPMVLLSTMVAAVFADFVSKMCFGMDAIFHFEVTESIPIQYYGLFIILGLLLGVSGVVYNICLVRAQAIYRKLSFVLDRRVVPVIPFLCAGILGLTFPVVLCGGHALIEELNLSTSLLFLCAALLLKFLFSMVSFGAGAPGGIFFPLLVLGGTIGAIFAKLAIPLLGMDEVLFYNFIIIAMAGYFASIVRAPLTGIVLMIEMTGSLSQILPLIVTSAVAYIVAEECKNQPIYESLLENLLHGRGIHKKAMKREKILLEMVVQYGSEMEGKTLTEIPVPEKCLIVSIKRGEHDITPNGQTVVKAGDYLSVLTSLNYELLVRAEMEKMCGGR
ncbi:MAG: ClC family H(+)/Cl(-) exchange transporter [Faecalibacterium sp.]